MEAEGQVSQLAINQEIYRIRREMPTLTPDKMCELLTSRLNTHLSEEDVTYRLQLFQKLPKESLMDIMKQFSHYLINFPMISSRTAIPLALLKKEIISVLVSNIWKVCFLVRKRSISSLKSNFISSKNIKNLVIIMLRPTNVASVKEEYSILWNFISHYYDESYFRSFTDQLYKQVYRELIILSEKYKVNDLANDEGEQGFERRILEQTVTQEGRFSNEFEGLLNDFKKRVQKETIDLVSEQEEDREELQSSMELLPPEQMGKITCNQLLVVKIQLCHRMSILEQSLAIGDVVKEEMARVGVEIAYIDYLLEESQSP